MQEDKSFSTKNSSRQAEVMTAIDSYVLFNGPFGSGKTRLLGEKCYYLASTFPGFRCCLARKELNHLKATTWEQLLDKVIPHEAISYTNKQDPVVVLKNGSKIFGRGLDRPRKFASTEYAFIGLEQGEETDEKDFVFMDRALRQPDVPFTQFLVACNPDAPSHYLYKYFYQKQLRDKETKKFCGRIIEGEVLWNLLDEKYKTRLNNLRGVYRERYLNGKWLAFSGLIYDNFDIRKHVIEPFKIPPEWPMVMGIDFGFTAPFSCQWWAKDPMEEKFYLVKEIYHTNRTVKAHFEKMGKICDLYDCWNAICDWDAEGMATLERDCVYKSEDGREKKISCIEANKNVQDGIQNVYNMITDNKIYIFENALVERDDSLLLGQVEQPICTVDEFGCYRWNEKKDLPVSDADHGLDALRYVMNTPWKPKRKKVGIHIIRGRN